MSLLFFEQLLLRGLKHPWKIILLIATVILLLSSGIVRLEISNDFRVYLSKDNPQLKAFEAFEADYVKSDTATFVITAKHGDLFTREGLTLIEKLTTDSWQIDYVYRVSSLANYQYTQAFGDDVETNYLIENASDLTDSKIIDIKDVALNEKRLIRRLITPDGKLALVAMNLNLPGDLANASIAVTEQVEKLRDQYRTLYPNYLIDNGGSTAFNTTLARAVANDMATLLPLSYFVIFAGLIFLLRNLSGTFAIFVLITSCLLTTFGVFGWFSPVLTPIAGFAPSILLSIMIADSVHILVIYYQQMEKTTDKLQAIAESLKINLMPVLITSITTMVGFLSLNFSTSPPYRDLGNMVAVGVLIALIFSLVFLPALLAILPIGKQRFKSVKIDFSAFSKFVIKFRKGLFVTVSLLTIVAITYIPNNRISDNWANYFDDSFEIIQLVKRIDGYLSGINSLEYSLSASQPGGIFSPDYLRQIEQFEKWFMQQNKVVNVISLSQLMKDLNQVMHGDKIESYKVPETSDMAAQYLLFYELGLPSGLGLNNLVTIHKDASRFTVSVSDAGSDELLELDRRAKYWLSKNAPAVTATSATGLGVVFAHIAQRNITSLLVGTLVALVGISALLVIVFRSAKYGLISLIPNIIPAAIAYGVWGMSYGYVDISLSIVACSTLGIVVDDTVHFLHKYIRARRQGLNAEAAVTDSFQRVGPALLTTTLVLSGGFFILSVSHMNTSAMIGMLMAITLIFALVVDFLLLPVILLFADKDSMPDANN